MAGQEDRMGTRRDRTIRRNRFDVNERMNQHNRYSDRGPTVRNRPSMINDRPETKAWNILKNFAPTGGNVGRHVGNYLADRFGIGSLANKDSFYSGGSSGPKERKKLQPRERSNQEPLRSYRGWENVTPRDVRYDPQLPVEYQYPSGGRTRVSDVKPEWTDFGSPYREGPPTEGVPMTPEWQWPEGYWPQNYQAGIVNTSKGSSILDDYFNYSDSNFDFDFGKQKVSWTPELLGGNLDASISPEELYLGMKWDI